MSLQLFAIAAFCGLLIYGAQEIRKGTGKACHAITRPFHKHQKPKPSLPVGESGAVGPTGAIGSGVAGAVGHTEGN